MRLIKESRYTKLDELARQGFIAQIIPDLSNPNKSNLIKSIPKTTSQIGQDLFVLSETNFKKNGFFVEFGATNGISLSNTYILEKEYGWRGILAEPAKFWQIELANNRICNIEHNCVWKESGITMTFTEADMSEYSTISKFKSADSLSQHRGGISYAVQTISLEALLDKYNAPSVIDYLSIDTEGSEFDILENFDFNKYKFKLITCEHNHSENRQKIFQLLTKNGYTRKYESISRVDDWYVLAE